MQQMNCHFVYWYNKQHQRTGSLFEDRFRSEIIRDERYLLTVFRYIHQNPVKAGICESPHQYAWSSYREYWNGQFKRISPTLSNRYFPSADECLTYLSFPSDTQCLDIDSLSPPRISDEEALRRVIRLFGKDYYTLRRKYSNEDIDKIRLLRQEGLSIRQISRLTGFSKTTLHRWIK